MKPTIHAFSKADSVAGQGVGSAYLEQVQLIERELSDQFDILGRARLRGGFGDINHFHSINPEYFAAMIPAARRGATVAHVHFIPETVNDSIRMPRPARAVFDRYMLAFYRRAQHLVTVNPWFITKLADDYGMDPQRITFIPNFVSADDFRPLAADDPRIAAMRTRFGVPTGRPVVLCAGQLQVRKGFFDFLAVARALPHVQFLWAGDFSFGRITAGHSEITRAMRELPANVNLVGLVPRGEMNVLFNLADAFFLPSFEELFPMTILEAMAAHTPVVVRDLVYYDGVLHDYAARIDAAPGEIDRFVQQLQRILEPGAVRDAAVADARRGAEFYNRDSVARQWRDFYTALLPA